MSQAAALLDPEALLIVTTGTLLATLARCGWQDTKTALSALMSLGSPTFDENSNRASLARSLRAIQERGRLSADVPLPPDRATAKMLQAYLTNGSLAQLKAAAKAQRCARERVCIRERRAFESAGELAPIFGLVGTLFAITQLAPTSGADAAETTMAAVATAVLSSMYGVLSAHLIYLPLARAIERRGENEEAARSAVLDWFEAELTNHHDARAYNSRDPNLRDVA
ncbi:MAG: MotA/TolQ/ExbB proton channel family protein [Pseudomonadota bacterium]